MSERLYFELASFLPDTSEVFVGDEDGLVPASESDMRRGVREAMARFADLLPAEDDCQCLTCRRFRAWLEPTRLRGTDE